MQRIKLIGKDINYQGKTLWEIVGNLKDYGVGRLVTRTMFERYPEPSFYKIVKVIPQQDLPEPSYDKYRKVVVWVETVFRGQKYPRLKEIFSASYKFDYKLIPKEDEEIWLKRLEEVKKPEPKYVQPITDLPPLLKTILMAENEDRGISTSEEDLKLRLRINQTMTNRARATTKNPDAKKLEYGYGTPISPSLFENIEPLKEYYCRDRLVTSDDDKFMKWK